MEEQNQETEVKFYLRHPADMEQRLHKLGAHLIQPHTHEINLRFDTPDGNFRRAGRVLRLRQDQAARLTYKDTGRLTDGALSRREIEFAVSEFNAARQFLQALGYEVVFMYEKYRTTYEMGEVHIMLDELPYGNFMEIEGGLQALKSIAEKMHLDWEVAIPASYHALFERLCEARRLTFRDLSFENFTGMEISSVDLGTRPAD